MANRATPLTNIETLSGNISAATYFDNNISPALTALNDASLGYVNYIGTDTGSANNYIVAAGFGTPSALNVGTFITFKPANSNTAASTLTFSPLSSGAIVRPDGTACSGGEIIANIATTVIYDGVSFRLPMLPRIPVISNLGTISTNQTVECGGAYSVVIGSTFTANNVFVTCAHAMPGTPIVFAATNSSGATANIFPQASNPSGSAYTSQFVQQGIAGIVTGFSVGNSKSLIATGSTGASGVFFLMGITSL